MAREIFGAIREKEINKLKGLSGCISSIVNSSFNGDTLLFHALRYGAGIEIVKFLVEQGADVNKPDGNGWTPLHTAASICSKEVVDLLLTNNADINAKNPRGDTPLHVAMHDRSVDAANSLIKRGAEIGVDNMDAKNKFEETPRGFMEHYKLERFIESIVSTPNNEVTNYAANGVVSLTKNACAMYEC